MSNMPVAAESTWMEDDLDGYAEDVTSIAR